MFPALVAVLLFTQASVAAPIAAPKATAAAQFKTTTNDGALWIYTFELDGLAAGSVAEVSFTVPTGWKVSAGAGVTQLAAADATPGLVSYTFKTTGAKASAELRPETFPGVSDSVPWKAILKDGAKDRTIGQGELPGLAALAKPVEGTPPKATVEWSARDEAGQTEWTYKFKFENVKPKDGKVELAAVLTLPAGVMVAPTPTVSTEVSGTMGGLANYRFSTVLTKEPWEFSLTVKADTKLTTAGRVAWIGALAGTEVGKGTVSGPTALALADIRSLANVPKKEPEKTSTWWRFIFGAGAAYALDDPLTFEVEDDILILKNSSEWRTTAVLGVAFRTRRSATSIAKRLMPNEITVAVDFAPNTTKDVDGVTFGAVWTVQPYLGVMAGARLRRGEVLGDGFQREAALFVARQQASDDPAVRNAYERFTLNQDRSNLASQQHYDGFPLTNADGQRFYRASPLQDSHNVSFIIGVVVPIQFSFAPK